MQSLSFSLQWNNTDILIIKQFHNVCRGKQKFIAFAISIKAQGKA